MGAVATTFIAGVEAIRNNYARPIGSLTQMGTIRLGKRTERRTPLIKDFVPLSSLNDLVFGGWDINNETCYETAVRSGVLEAQLLNLVRPSLEKIRPWKAVFSQEYVKRLKGTNVKQGKNKYELALQVIEDIKRFKSDNSLDRLVMIWCGSTEIYLQPSEVHSSLKKFEKGLKNNDSQITSSMIHRTRPFAGHPLCQRRPNLSADIPAMVELAQESPICGKRPKQPNC
jgi:myo-inositol-1-phosphate synthase